MKNSVFQIRLLALYLSAKIYIGQRVMHNLDMVLNIECHNSVILVEKYTYHAYIKHTNQLKISLES